MLLVLLGAGTLALAQTNAPLEVRQLTLQGCIELALTNNLDLQIDRYNPQISLYNVRATYGDYDPTLNLSGSHSHNEQGSQLFGSLLAPGSTADSDTIGGTLSGLLPWGTTYTLGTLSPFNDTTQSRTAFAPDLNNFTLTTNYQTLAGNPPVTQGVLATNYAQVPYQQSFENSSARVGLQVSQPLLKNFWIDSTRLNIRVAKNRLKYSEQTLTLQIMQTITSLEQAYYDLIYYRENVAVQQKAVELAERLVMENRKRLEVGALAPLDLQSAEAQAASTRAAVIAAKSQLGTQERLVKSLITDRYRDHWATVTLEPAASLTAPVPVVNLQDSWNKGLSLRPELTQAKLDVEKQGIQLKYDHNQLYPELDVIGSFGYNGAGLTFNDAAYDIQNLDRKFYSVGGQFIMPLSRTRARNTYKADKASMQQVVLTLKKLEQGIMIQIDNDIGTLRANYDAVQATRQARQYEESALDAEQKKLESGKSTTYTVLQVQRDLTTARGNEIQALDTYNKSLSQLSLDEGSTLQRLGINLDIK
jgi:outer membrane protein TolC